MEALRHTARPWPVRPALFIDVNSGACLHEDGRAFGARGALSLARVLSAAVHPGWGADGAPRVVYLVGGWNAGATPKTEWFEAPGSWTRASYHRNPLLASYKHPSSRKISMYTTAQWFGQCPDISLCQRAYTRLRSRLRSSFDSGVALMGTPARTGLDLLERSLPRDKEGRPYEYPVLDAEFREKIEHNIGQGRMEMLQPVEGTPETADKLYVLDAFWMYAACCRNLPVGPIEYDQRNEFAGYRPGFYHVVFRVPAGWAHIGLLPVWNPKQKRPVWPARPGTGYEYHSYVGQDELKLALEQGWSVRIVERWLFAEVGAKGSDPGRLWVEKLQALREQATDEREGDIAPLLRSAYRSLLIKALGSLHRKGRYEQYETPIERSEEIPEDAEIIWRDDRFWRWRQPIALDKSMLKYQHPEWPAMVWSKARARLNKAALLLPRSVIVALRSDAIVTTIDPGWSPAKRPGDFRLKEILRLAPGQRLPRTSPEYLALRAANALEEEEVA